MRERERERRVNRRNSKSRTCEVHLQICPFKDDIICLQSEIGSGESGQSLHNLKI